MADMCTFCEWDPTFNGWVENIRNSPLLLTVVFSLKKKGAKNPPMTQNYDFYFIWGFFPDKKKYI